VSDVGYQERFGVDSIPIPLLPPFLAIIIGMQERPFLPRQQPFIPTDTIKSHLTTNVCHTGSHLVTIDSHLTIIESHLNNGTIVPVEMSITKKQLKRQLLHM